MTSVSGEKWRPFNCFFSRVGLRTCQHPCSIHHTITPEPTTLPYLCCSSELVDSFTVTVKFRPTFSFSSYFFLSLYLFPPTHCRCRELQLHLITLCRTPLIEGSARSRNLYLQTHESHKRNSCPLRVSNP